MELAALNLHFLAYATTDFVDQSVIGFIIKSKKYFLFCKFFKKFVVF
jgi:hypothetical protein